MLLLLVSDIRDTAPSATAMPACFFFFLLIHPLPKDVIPCVPSLLEIIRKFLADNGSNTYTLFVSYVHGRGVVYGQRAVKQTNEKAEKTA